MYIIEVIPLQHLPKSVSQILYYFHKNPLSQGAIVEITIKTQKIMAIVASTTPLDKIKNEIKSSDFNTKKISSIIYEKPLASESFWKIAKFVSEYYFDDLTRVVKTLLPKNITSIIKYLEKNKLPSTEPDELISFQKETPLFSENFIEKINSTLQNNQSVFFAFSTNAELIFYLDHFSSYFNKENFIVIDEKVSQKNLNQAYQTLLGNKPTIIFSLRKGLSLPLDNLGLIAIFNSNDDSYKSWDRRPYLNFETILKWYAKVNKIDIIFQKDELSLALHKTLKNELSLMLPLKKLDPAVNTQVIFSDLFNYDQTLLSGTFKRELLNQENKKWIFFTNQKGYHHGLICKKCHYIFSCLKCKKPLTYHQTSKNKFFYCRLCEAKFYAKNYCPKCNSINLTPLNQGVDRLAEEIKTFLKEKNIPTFALKQEHPEEKSLAIINDFNLAEKGIILGTSYLFKPQLAKVKNVAAINLDNLFYLPDFKTEEKILSLLIKLKSLSTKNFFIKTTVKDHPLFEIIKNHDFESFWQDELLLRKRYLFPPFSQIIQISNKNKSKERAQQELEASFEKITKTIQKNKLEKKFATTSVCPNYHEKINDTYFWNFKIKMILDKPMIISKKDLKMRNQLLKILPDHFYIDVDPVNFI